MKTHKYSKYLLYILLFSFFVIIPNGCSTESSDPSSNINIPNSVVRSTVIDPDEGGVITLPSEIGGGSLEIPPGALNKTTTISVYILEQITPGRLHLAFEPDGLVFNKPVKLTLHYDLDNEGQIPLIKMYQISDLNDLVDMGSEEHRWESFDNMSLDDVAQTVSGELDHFSTGLIFFGTQRTAYLIFDLPGKYLRPGDGVFVLSGGSTLKYDWFPGHVGMIRSIDENTGTTNVIESTISGGVLSNVNGVQVNDLTLFKSASHVFMGARRTIGSKFSENERIGAVTFAESHKYEVYEPWAAPLTAGHSVGWSCTSLLEASWDKVDRGAMGVFSFFPSPVEMFEETVPINEIEVVVGEEARIPVYPVVIRDVPSMFSSKQYDAGSAITNPMVGVTVTGLPSNATWAADPAHRHGSQTVVWTPKPEDAGNTYEWTFRVNGTVTIGWSTRTYDETRILKVKVRGAHDFINVTPIQMGVPGRSYSKYFPIPTGGIIQNNEKGELIDTVTGLFPTNPIFNQQELDTYRDEWLDPINKTKFGYYFHIERLDNINNPAPPGNHTWLYWLDYKVPKYMGP